MPYSVTTTVGNATFEFTGQTVQELNGAIIAATDEIALINDNLIRFVAAVHANIAPAATTVNSTDSQPTDDDPWGLNPTSPVDATTQPPQPSTRTCKHGPRKFIQGTVKNGQNAGRPYSAWVCERPMNERDAEGNKTQCKPEAWVWEDDKDSVWS